MRKSGDPRNVSGRGGDRRVLVPIERSRKTESGQLVRFLARLMEIQRWASNASSREISS